MIVALMAVGLVACTTEPAPAPLPTPSALSSEDAAFAAAEATYRAYVDALNRVDLADPSTFEPVFSSTVDEARASAEALFDSMHEKGWTVTGTTRAHKIEPMSSDSPDEIVLSVCVDVSAVELVDNSGKSVVDPDRTDIQPMRVALRQTNDDTWLISSFEGREGEPLCEKG